MADEDKEKAEKVAAARKRYEQLKKQKAKKDQAAKKKKEEKEEKPDPAEASNTAAEKSEPTEEASTEPQTNDGDDPDTSNTPIPPASDVGESQPPDDNAIDDEDGVLTSSEPSASEKSRLRSESFKRNESQTQTTTLKSSSGPPSSSESATDLYKKQAARIEQLEKENKRLEKEVEGKQKSLSRVEQENDDLRDTHADAADLKDKAGQVGGLEEEIKKLSDEVSSLQRQNTQLTAAAQSKDRRRASADTSPSSTSPDDLESQLAAKTSTIESLELDLSNLRYIFTTTQSENATLLSRITTLEASLSSTEASLKSAQDELASLRASTSTPTATPGDDSGNSAAATREQLLNSDLASAQSHASAETARAATLQKQNDALKTINREAEARNTAATASITKERDRLRAENTDLRAKAGNMSSENARLRAGSVNAATTATDTEVISTEGDDGDEDPRRRKLQNRVRELETELHNLRSNTWRNQRIELQRHADGSETSEAHLMDDDPGVRSPGFDDVDLNASMSASTAGTGGGKTPPGFQRMRSNPYGAFGLSNVISAFTGPSGDTGKPSISSAQLNQVTSNAAALAGGFLNNLAEIAGVATTTGTATNASYATANKSHASNGEFNDMDDDDDFAFDEDAFRKAREEEGMKRLERVREIKRGLKEWEGWRVDLVDVRGGEAAGVFEV